jgi:hypothetical protein
VVTLFLILHPSYRRAAHSVSSASQNQAILKKFLLKAFFPFSYSLCFSRCRLWTAFRFFFYRIFSMYPFFFLVYRDIRISEFTTSTSKSQEARIPIRVTIGMGVATHKARVSCRVTSSLVSPLTNYKHIFYPRIHFRSTPVVTVLVLHARTDNKEFVSPVAEGEVDEMGKKSISRRNVTRRLF